MQAENRLFVLAGSNSRPAFICLPGIRPGLLSQVGAIFCILSPPDCCRGTLAVRRPDSGFSRPRPSWREHDEDMGLFGLRLAF